MARKGQKDQKALAALTFWDWMRIPFRWLYSFFWRENRSSSDMSTREQEDQKALATLTFWDWMRIPFRWLYSFFWRKNRSSSDMSTREQEDQKAPATCKFWDRMRKPLFPFRWIYSYFWHERNTAAYPKNEAIQNITQDTLYQENEKEVFTLKTDNSKLKSRNEELKEQLSSREQEVINLNMDCSQLRARNKTLETLCQDKKQEVLTLKENYCKLQSRNEELQRHLSSREEEVITLNRDCSQLRTRLSQIAAMQLTEGNPNIADLSDQNRPDKLAEQFSELYDNQWTDCYQVLTDNLGKTEEDSIKILLEIVKTSYDICLDGSKNILTTAKDILFAFAGRSDEEPDKALDTLIQEILHKLKSHRTKSFKAAPTNIEKKIRVKLMSMIGKPETDACDSFIEECIRTCWLMCIKDPPMYIFCNQEDVFDKNKYMEYTEMGNRVAYVVWPALYLHKDGPLMRKGVAQGEGKKYVNVACNSGRNGDEISSSGLEPEEKNICESLKQVEMLQSTNVLISYDNNLGKVYEDENFQSAPKENKTESKQQSDSFVSSDEYFQPRENVGAFNEENQGKETQDGIIECNNQSSIKDEALESKEQGDIKLVSSDESCQHMQTSGAGDINEEEHQGKETQYGFIELDNGQKVKKGIKSMHVPLAINTGDYSKDTEEEKGTQLINVHSLSDNSWKEQKEENNSQSSTKCDPTEIKEPDDNKLVSSDEYCQQRMPSGASNINEEEHQVNTTQDGFGEFNKGQDTKEGISIIPVPQARNIDDSPNDAEEKERTQSINVRFLSDDNWKEGKEKCSQTSTKDDEIKSKDQVDNKVFSYDDHSQQMETSRACNINKEENQGKETKDGFIECTNGREVKEAALIVHAPSDMNIYDSPNDVEPEERQKSTNVCSSSDYSCSDDKEEEDVQFSTKDEATESKEQEKHKLFLQKEYCQQSGSSGSGKINEENQGEQTQDWVILCNDGQEMNEVANVAHETLEENTCDSSNDTEQERRLQLTDNSSSSDDNKTKDKDIADFQSSP